MKRLVPGAIIWKHQSRYIGKNNDKSTVNGIDIRRRLSDFHRLGLLLVLLAIMISFSSALGYVDGFLAVSCHDDVTSGNRQTLFKLSRTLARNAGQVRHVILKSNFIPVQLL